jgi:replicative DNA helicase
MKQKEFPKSLESEKSVLGAMMFNCACIPEIVGQLYQADFYERKHQKLYNLILDLYQRNKHLDMVSLCDHLISTQNAESYGGIAYVSGLPESFVAEASIPYYINRIRENAIRRKMVVTSQKIQDNAYDQSLDIDELIENGQQELLKMAGARRDSGWHTAQEMVTEASSRWAKKVDKFRAGESAGLSTGIKSLDDSLSGMEPGLLLLAARPSMGKTALALNITLNVLKQDKAVAFFSLEMDRHALLDRMVSCMAGVPSWRIRTGDLSDEHLSTLDREALDPLFNAPLFIHDEAGSSMASILAKARRLKARNANLALIVVDYLQLIQQPRAESMEQGVSQISSGMKIMSRELGVPVLCLAQLNRGCESRSNPRPKLSDLRGSGSLEQDADVVMFLFRKAYYKDRADPNEAEVLIGKHRNGPTGNVQLHWDSEYQRFSEAQQSMGSKMTVGVSQRRKRRDIDDVDDDDNGLWV